MRTLLYTTTFITFCAAWSASPALAQSPAAAAAARGAVPSPADVLGHALGERFTDHAGVLRYLEALAAAAADRVRLEHYGETPEGRPLLQLVIARPDHLARLDDVLARNRELTQPGTPPARAADIAAANPAVVYFSYGVHGNESSSTEAALWTAWDLATNADEVRGVLDALVVVIDPALNPDGRDRYVHWYAQARGVRPNPSPAAREHWEPWPGGRFNHYLFDLNRDWAWATQPETRARLATWDRWSPQVHVDFHEMSHTSSYFFFPAAPPINPLYPRHIAAWGRYFGAANAAAFDARGWAYYTGERFDLFYPGYGDSWPSLLGAIGMTYEQAGGGRAGLAVVRPDGDTLTLRQRATQHRAAGAATLRAAAQRRMELLHDFAAFHRHVDDGLPDILLVPDAQGRSEALLRLLELQGIAFERAGRPFRAAATAHAGHAARREFPAGTYRVPARQPRGRLAITLLQPETVLDVTYSYDVSAWSLPFAYGVEAHSAVRVPDAAWQRASGQPGAAPAAAPGDGVGALVRPALEHWPALIAYLRAGGRVVALERPFTMAGTAWPAGSLFLPRDTDAVSFAQRLADSRVDRFAVPVHSRLAGDGPDLGTENATLVRVPRIAVLTGDGVSASSFGAHWFMLEQTLGLEFDAVPLDRIASVELGEYDVVVAPDMARAAPERVSRDIERWVRAGGTLIAVAGGARQLGSSIADIAIREAPEEPDSVLQRRALAGREERRIERWEAQVPGTIVAMRLDPEHPLAAGSGIGADASRMFVLRTGDLVFEPDADFETVASFGPQPERISGVISARNLDMLANAAWLVTRRLERGRVILFADDPLFRHFWYATFQPYVNAVMVGPRL